ncbi:hydantoinase/oxoprolinase family protein [Methyloligella sp. 2.7D]|uniref:hydantoinase/oxoprolinase family protein n=1 Tax=unclassified Methyloligella TaxID=2625955 RepID=UPI00157BE9E0|nr:hydantoinase/oxoprolinase family protein [Methyloligella sp. GL2]QKP77782.1 H4MPT-linked C1 transfer pathway protein [Methyloligella sp. GL2]
MSDIIGWDLGGANLKFCRQVDGRPVAIMQIPCPIIPDRRKFDDAAEAALAAMPEIAKARRHAVTMTGELSDVFESRPEGVTYLVDLMLGLAKNAPVCVYGGRAGFLKPVDAIKRWEDVASANWHGTAAFAASVVGDGLLIDIGTTTADLIPLRKGVPCPRGYSDGERLTEGELIYRGVVRTPVMALRPTAPFQGRMQGVAAEKFATLADIYRLTGALPGDADPYPTADSRGKSGPESAARLARMLGRDLEDATYAEWVALAEWFAACQCEDFVNAAFALIDRDGIPPDAPVIGAGCGRFVAEAVAKRLQRPYRDFGALAGAPADLRGKAADYAPAVAMALLAEKSSATNPLPESCL